MAYESENDKLKELCDFVRKSCDENTLDCCKEKIYKSMSEFPNSPVPHNLLGIILEKQGEHPLAMKHFRASWALDPTYRPANYNMQIYGTFYNHRNCAFDENDIREEKKESNVKLVYDSEGIGHIIYKNRIEYDKNGIGHIVKEEI